MAVKSKSSLKSSPKEVKTGKEVLGKETVVETAEASLIGVSPLEVAVESLLPIEAAAQAQLALAFRALGDPVRIRIFRFLRLTKTPVAVHKKSGRVRTVAVENRNGKHHSDSKTKEVKRTEGITVGDVVAHLADTDKTASTISHHLKELRQAGLVTMQRQGKHMICTVNETALQNLSAFLMEQPLRSPDSSLHDNQEWDSETEGYIEADTTVDIIIADATAVATPVAPMKATKNGRSTRRRQLEENNGSSTNGGDRSIEGKATLASGTDTGDNESTGDAGSNPVGNRRNGKSRRRNAS